MPRRFAEAANDLMVEVDLDDVYLFVNEESDLLRPEDQPEKQCGKLDHQKDISLLRLASEKSRPVDPVRFRCLRSEVYSLYSQNRCRWGKNVQLGGRRA